ncbi:MAG: T9SS type A sorting domain-containing protein, partial [Lewinella sp.]|nr:T9SS type A sorting domain-containing protein [Lewinella sp.]
TDHGAAAPLMLFGPGLEGNGFLGGLPDLDNLDNNGNLQFTVDFRQIYATVLEQWLCLDPDQVDLALGDTFERLHDLGLSCSVTSTGSPRMVSSIDLQAFYYRGFLNVEYQLPQGMPVDITLYNMLGQPMRNVFSGYQAGGPQQQRFPLNDIGWASGIYVCTVRAGGQVYSRQIRLTH